MSPYGFIFMLGVSLIGRGFLNWVRRVEMWMTFLSIRFLSLNHYTYCHIFACISSPAWGSVLLIVFSDPPNIYNINYISFTLLLRVTKMVPILWLTLDNMLNNDTAHACQNLSAEGNLSVVVLRLVRNSWVKLPSNHELQF